MYPIKQDKQGRTVHPQDLYQLQLQSQNISKYLQNAVQIHHSRLMSGHHLALVAEHVTGLLWENSQGTVTRPAQQQLMRKLSEKKDTADFILLVFRYR